MVCVSKSKTEFTIFTEVYSAILEIQYIQVNWDIISRHCPKGEPHWNLPSKLFLHFPVLLLIWVFLPLLLMSLSSLARCSYVFIFICLTVEDSDGTLADICRKWTVSQLGIFFIHIKWCVKRWSLPEWCWCRMYQLAMRLLYRGNRKGAEYEIPKGSQNCAFESDFKLVVY